MIRRKQNEELEQLRRSDARTYWTKLKTFLGLGKGEQRVPKELKLNNRLVDGEAAKNAWKEAFQKHGQVNEVDTEFDEQHKKECEEQIDEWIQLQKEAQIGLDKPIDREEVVKAIKLGRSGKAGGYDGIIGEILKNGGEDMIEITWRLCREVFEAEKVPRGWSKGLIFPLFKGGDRKVTDNYRPIYLLSIVSKLYASILNNRLLNWCEQTKKFGEEQAGFRPGRSTTDQAFVLSEVIRDRKQRGLETHIAFLDVRKAYDTVWRVGLWKRLLDIEMNGKLWRVIQNIYQVVESSVILGDDLTQWFMVELGVRQGCTLSPLLFLIFVEGVSQRLRKSSVGLRAGKSKFNHLLFADDIAICAGSRQELQALLDIVYQYSVKWRFKFNIAKSNVMVIKKTKGLTLHHYYLGLEQLKVVRTYKYLGLDFEDNLRWNITQERLTAKARGRVALLCKGLKEGLSLKAAESMWWAMVVPVLNYGTEIWGSGKCVEIERVQLETGRRILGVGKKTADNVVRGELGWWTMKAQRNMKKITLLGKIGENG